MSLRRHIRIGRWREVQIHELVGRLPHSSRVVARLGPLARQYPQVFWVLCEQLANLAQLGFLGAMVALVHRRHDLDLLLDHREYRPDWDVRATFANLELDRTA